MANEFKHDHSNIQLTQGEYESLQQHVFDGQATGDILYASSASQLSRLAGGTQGYALLMGATIPQWGGLCLRNLVAGLAATIQNTTDAASNQVLQLSGGNRAVPANNDEAYVALTLDNDAGNQTEFARLIWVTSDHTVAGGLDGTFQIESLRNGTLEPMVMMGFDVNSTGLVTWNDDSQDLNYTWKTVGGAMSLDGGTDLLTLPGAISLGDAFATWTASLDSAAVADEVSISGYEIGAGARALAISQEDAVITEAVGASDRTLRARINGVTLKFMLHT